MLPVPLWSRAFSDSQYRDERFVELVRTPAWVGASQPRLLCEQCD